MTLPVLATNIKNRIVQTKIERKPRRPNKVSRIDAIVKEAMELND